MFDVVPRSRYFANFNRRTISASTVTVNVQDSFGQVLDIFLDQKRVVEIVFFQCHGAVLSPVDDLSRN